MRKEKPSEPPEVDWNFKNKYGRKEEFEMKKEGVDGYKSQESISQIRPTWPK